MELLNNTTTNQIIDPKDIVKSKGTNFIEANTKEVALKHLKEDCVIPVFAKDNESTISHYQFIEATKSVVDMMYSNETVNEPEVRVSHVIKGRVPSAIGKPARELLPEEKTIYYERMAFVIEVPSISEVINQNQLSLTIGGVRSYSEQNLYSKKALEKFKMFIGFKNMVCLNLCLSTDGFSDSVRIGSIDDLESKILEMVSRYDQERHLELMSKMSRFQLKEKEFAHLVGKLKMYQHLNKEELKTLPEVSLNDGQINQMIKGYYGCPNFSRNTDGDISFWNVYNLMTEANKSSYIDNNFQRSVHAYELINNLVKSKENRLPNWLMPSV
jgi:hypothetical protein